jgi:hypothetical protein
MKTNGVILLVKPSVVMALLAPLLCSCYSYRSITRTEPVTRDLLVKLEPGKDYLFKLKTGLKYKVFIDSIKSEQIAGYIYQKNAKGKVVKMRYSSTFEDVEMYVAKISVRKSAPVKIILLMAIPFVVLIYGDSLRFMFFGG